MRRQLSYLWALMLANMRSYGPERKRLFIMSLFMIIQNSMFFAIWVIFFQTVDSLKGWQLTDVSRMFGLVASSIGISLFLFNGARTIAYRLTEGTMDSFITRPRHVLPALLISSSSPASLGDVLYGPLLWFTLGDVSISTLPWLTVLTVLSAILFTSVTIIMFSIAFWMKGSPRFPEQLFEMLIMFSTSILHGQPFGVKLLVFTLIPAGFISYVPTQLMRGFDPVLFGILLLAVIFYCVLALLVFNAGLKRYVRGAV